MDLLEKLAKLDKKCSGCGACYNICPQNAISKVADSQGFLYPHINQEKCVNCLKCEKICPKLNSSECNFEEPACYAAWADDEIRQQSSSGGLFCVLAKYVLHQGGVVCGVEMTRDFHVHHICIEDETKLYRLQKSKYVQSDTEYIYREISDYIHQGKKVLFTGCPCQVAAARNYFHNSESVIYVDILCHGVPSEQMWKDYVEENFDIAKVATIDFRNKKMGWRSDQIYVSYNDGAEAIIPWCESAYEEGFQRNITLRDGCEDCEFSGHKRQGDLTIGDFWRVEEYAERLNTCGRGTSVLLVNNYRGERILYKIKKDLIQLEQVPLEAARYNRLEKSFLPHPDKARFSTLYPHRKFDDAVFQVKNNQYDIGLVGTYTVSNYGGHLTQYALYETLIEMGYSVLMIECPMDSKVPPNPLGPFLFAKDPYPAYAKSKYYPNIAEMKELNHKCNYFITGSDQMFNNNMFRENGQFMTLNFVNDNHKKIAYAASNGHEYIWGPEIDRAAESYFLKKFDFFSVREASAVKLFKEEFGIEATHVLDPVFLCNKKKYEELIQKGKKTIPDCKYLFAYILDVNIEKECVINTFAEKQGLYVRAFCDASPIESQEIYEKWAIDTMTNQSVESWIAHIANAEFVITDSFHGMCLCLIFEKQFYCIANKRRGETRFDSILTQVGLMDRKVSTFNELSDKLEYMCQIDYAEVKAKLQKYVDDSRAWLINAIETKANKKPLSAFDILDARSDDLCRKFDRKCDLLNKGVHSIEKEVNSLEREMNECKDLLRQYAEKLDRTEDDKQKLELERNQLEEEKNYICHSASYKLGRSLTYIPRKVRACLKK